MTPFRRLIIPDALLARVIEHAWAELPKECCGLLAGLIADGDGYAIERATIRNDRASPTGYLTNAHDLFAAYREMRATGTEVLAVYHSHPTSNPVPSRRDVAENTYGETVVHLIVSLSDSEPEVRAWWISESGFREAEWNRS
jgi:proteasome lid subunit RPN8/RPN11